jgi:hypothetical protein
LRPNLERGIIICLLVILILLIVEDRRFYSQHNGKRTPSGIGKRVPANSIKTDPTDSDTIHQKDDVGVDEPGRNRNGENYREPDRKDENDREDEEPPPEAEVNNKGDGDVNEKTSIFEIIYRLSVA